MTSLVQNLRLAVRQLRQAPAFALTAIGTLALGIGATTAIFSTINAALLRPLPYPEAEALYGLRTALTDGRVTTGLLSPAEVVGLNDPTLGIGKAAGMLRQDVTLLRDDGGPVKTAAYGVSELFFDVFGLPMEIGPGLTADNITPNGPPQVVISYRVWQDMFDGDPNVVGKPIRFAEITTTVIGVANRDFDTPHNADFWFGFPFDSQNVNHGFDGFLRLNPGVTIERAREQMASVMSRLADEFPASNMNRIYVVKPLVEQIVGDLSTILLVVLAATGVLLLIACVNVTNLQLARGTMRLREMAVRVALGASRRQIVTQLLTESVVIATAGALLGLALASAGIRVLLASGVARLPRLDTVAFDGQVLLFALAVTIVSGLVVGVAPALRLAGADLRTLMNESSRSASGGRSTARWLSGLMVAEIALAVTLVAGAGWLIRGFDNLRSADLGIQPQGRLAFDVLFNGPNLQAPEQWDAAVQDLASRLRALPGVRSVATTANLPLAGGQENSLYIEFRGEPFDSANPAGARQRYVGPGYFDTMGMTLTSGRDFTADDRADTQNVAVVNQTFVKTYLAGRDPIGVRFSSGYPQIFPESEAVVIGVVNDVRQKSVDVAGEPAFYTSDRQQPGPRRTFVLEVQPGQAASVQAEVRSEVQRTNPTTAVDIVVLSDMVASTLERQELGMTLMLVFGAVALILAAVGIYGVIAYAASQRRTEVATRLALGATQSTVFWLMVRQGRTRALIGAGVGLAVAFLGGRAVASRLYEVNATDPWILGTATAIVVVIALVATAIPAFVTSRLDPAQALRPE